MNKLHLPENPPLMDMTEAYVKSVVTVPALLNVINETLMDISDSLRVFAIYIEKKGLAEGVLSEGDLDEGDEDGQNTAA